MSKYRIYLEFADEVEADSEDEALDIMIDNIACNMIDARDILIVKAED